MSRYRNGLVLAAAFVLGVATLSAQETIYQRFAPVDLTGTWVSVVTEDWQFRMITPAKGDFANLSINGEAEKVALAWDPAKDEAAGLACQSYGAPTIMREPGRVRIAWASGNALRVEIDSGQQTRLFNFAGVTPPAGRAGWQGFSQASWEYVWGFDPLTVGAEPPNAAGRRGGGRGGSGRGAAPRAPGGALKVVTNHLRAGYLRKNGVPFSEDATVTEYFNVLTDDDVTWLVVTSIVHDPKYLRTEYITSSNFKKESDDSKWQPRPCTAR